nr:PcfJ domain-containing protein [Prosthecobacter sp.]
MSSLASLKQEGVAMSHCVFGYARRCREGSSAIFSLRHLEIASDGATRAVSYATIEVHPPSRKIVQIRAFRNRPVNNSCQRMIHEWARQNNLC